MTSAACRSSASGSTRGSRRSSRTSAGWAASRLSASWRSTMGWASWASPSSCRRADRPSRRAMLGRTDSRRRLLVLLAIFVVGSMALIARTAYWQVLNGDMLMTRAAAQTTVRIEVAGRRGDIYDRTGTVLLATTIDRDRLVAAADQLARDPAARTRTGDELVRLLKLDDAAAAQLRERLASERPYVVIARGIEPSMSERIRLALRDKRIVNVSLESEPERVYPQAGGGPE